MIDTTMRGATMKTIRAWRTERGLTQLELANRVGVTPSTVYGWESGRYEPKARQFRKLAEVLGVRMEEIDLEDEPLKNAA